MKKLFILLLLTLCLLAGCSEKKEDAEEETEADLSALTIVTPKGAPVLAFYDQIGNENYSRVTADAISALWTGNASPDILVVDLTSGVKAIENGAEYRLGAILTFGNFYLAATGSDEDGEMDKDDKIVLFGNENMLPNRLWHYLFGDEYDANLLFEADAAGAAAALASGTYSDSTPVDYVFLAQPALFASLKKNEKASVYLDIQEAYQQKSGMAMIQAALFVNDRVDEKTAAAFLKEREAAITAAIADPKLLEEGLSVYEGDEATAQYGFNPQVVVNVFAQKNAAGINAMGLGYRKAIDIKDDIDAFLELFGIGKTGEEIYIG